MLCVVKKTAPCTRQATESARGRLWTGGILTKKLRWSLKRTERAISQRATKTNLSFTEQPYFCESTRRFDLCQLSYKTLVITAADVATLKDVVITTDALLCICASSSHASNKATPSPKPRAVELEAPRA